MIINNEQYEAEVLAGMHEPVLLQSNKTQVTYLILALQYCLLKSQDSQDIDPQSKAMFNDMAKSLRNLGREITKLINLRWTDISEG